MTDPEYSVAQGTLMIGVLYVVCVEEKLVMSLMVAKLLRCSALLWTLYLGAGGTTLFALMEMSSFSWETIGTFGRCDGMGVCVGDWHADCWHIVSIGSAVMKTSSGRIC